MRVLTFGIKSFEDVFRDVEDAFDAIRLKRPFPPRKGVYFTSLEAARNFLTAKRLGLLRLIKTWHPNSIYRLAKLARRSFPSVLRDVELLERHGLLRLSNTKGSRRKSVTPAVGYDAINLWIPV